MLKTKILFPKRSKPTIQDQEVSEISSKPRKWPPNTMKQQFTQNSIFHENSKNKQNWAKKEEENLMISFFESIISEPYRSFTWNYFIDQENLTKISRNVNKPLGQCSRKINQMKSVNEEKYSSLDVIDFLMVHWKDQQFRSKMGRDLVGEIKKLKNTKSNHMVMLDQMMEQIKEQKPAFDSLFDLIMKN